jgi:hypothetical protein
MLATTSLEVCADMDSRMDDFDGFSSIMFHQEWEKSLTERVSEKHAEVAILVMESLRRKKLDELQKSNPKQVVAPATRRETDGSFIVDDSSGSILVLDEIMLKYINTGSKKPFAKAAEKQKKGLFACFSPDVKY